MPADVSDDEPPDEPGVLKMFGCDDDDEPLLP
jgi:hypothetical protein